jgi:hypothetical protein
MNYTHRGAHHTPKNIDSWNHYLWVQISLLLLTLSQFKQYMGLLHHKFIPHRSFLPSLTRKFQHKNIRMNNKPNLPPTTLTWSMLLFIETNSPNNTSNLTISLFFFWSLKKKKRKYWEKTRTNHLNLIMLFDGGTKKPHYFHCNSFITLLLSPLLLQHLWIDKALL